MILSGKALWGVDDENGSVTGVPFSMYLIAGPNVAFSAEEEIQISYGNKGNEELIYLYGFVIKNNPDDFIRYIIQKKLYKGLITLSSSYNFLKNRIFKRKFTVISGPQENLS